MSSIRCDCLVVFTPAVTGAFTGVAAHMIDEIGGRLMLLLLTLGVWAFVWLIGEAARWAADRVPIALARAREWLRRARIPGRGSRWGGSVAHCAPPQGPPPPRMRASHPCPVPAGQPRRRTGDARAGASGGGCARSPRVAVVSGADGMGSTTATLVLGQALALSTGGSIAAVDPSPGAVSLSARAPRWTGPVGRSQPPRDGTGRTGLEVVPIAADPRLDERLEAAECNRLLDLLNERHALVLMDLGAWGLRFLGPRGLCPSDQVVLVTDERLSAADGPLDWLERAGHGRLAKATVVIVNSPLGERWGSTGEAERALGMRCRTMMRVPYDPGLPAEGETTLDDLSLPTCRSYLAAAAAVAHGLPVEGAGAGPWGPAR